jgi:hypothetical protein
MTISVTQALAELKLLRRRIQSATQGSEFIVLRHKRDVLVPADFATSARAAYQSYTDLLARYKAIKSAIVLSNAATVVTIAGVEYTVADAVERKRAIDFEKEMLVTLQHQYDSVTKKYESHTAAEILRVERLLQSELSKDSKTNVEVIAQLTETFLNQNKAEILDPLDVKALIARMTRSIEDFETKVDWVLSESNGRTMIPV